LIPSWAPYATIGNRLINARAESRAEKPSFRDAFRRRRCLVLADGFFEWKKQGRKKEPYLMRLRDGKPFAFAGLWENWRTPDKTPLETCTILTTDANELVRPLHDRMPVILEAEAYEPWLDPELHDKEKLLPLLHSFPADKMTAYAVNELVNNPRNDLAKCLEPCGPEEETRPCETQKSLF